MLTERSLVLAVRVLAILAADPAGLVSSERLGRILDANPVVIRRLLGLLRADGLVETRRGPGGGCALAREPGGISIGRVYRALDRQPAPVEGSHLAAALWRADHAYLRELDRWTVAATMPQPQEPDVAPPVTNSSRTSH